jgi:hypothetical protein
MDGSRSNLVVVLNGRLLAWEDKSDGSHTDWSWKLLVLDVGHQVRENRLLDKLGRNGGAVNKP